MTAENYKACYDFTLQWEGGYVNHPKDPGGATNRGVIQRVYDAYRRRKALTPRSVRHITDDEVQEIYRKQYWDAVRGDELPLGVDLAVWDFGVNSGPSRSIRYLQSAVGVKQDGMIGEVTLAAVRGENRAALAALICNKRQSFVERLRTFSTFGKGWTRRISAARRLSVSMANSSMPTVDDAAPGTKPPPQPKAEGKDVAPTKTEGFWTKLGAIITAVGTGIAGILKDIPPYVGIALVVVAGVVVIVYFIRQDRKDEALL